MSTKWNERLVTSFLKMYKQYPCLWNPYHKDYYNCHEKNEALRKIIDALGTPGFTATDYLQQIKIIREKYKKEQTQIIKSMQCQKQYKSPFPWYNIMAEMLTKVIDDEEKASSGTILCCENQNASSILKSLSSDNVRGTLRKEKARTEAKAVKIHPCTCDEIIRRSKSAEKPTRGRGRCVTAKKNDENVQLRYTPCPQFKRRVSVASDKDEHTCSNYKPVRDIDPPVNEHQTVTCEATSSSSSRDRDKICGPPPFLCCPACGWENAKKPTHEQKSFIPCSSYNRDASTRDYTMCVGCDQVTRDVASHESNCTKKCVNHSGDFDIFQDLVKQVPRPNLTSNIVGTEPVRSPVQCVTEAKKGVDAETQYEEQPVKLATCGTSTCSHVQTQTFKLDPIAANQCPGGTIEACLKIILSESRRNLKENALPPVVRCTREVQCDRSESPTKRAHFSCENFVTGTKMNETGVNTVNYAEVGIQNTVCVSDEATGCVSIQTLYQTDREKKGKYTEYDESTVCRTKSKGATVCCEDKATKVTQRTVCTSRANLFCSTSLGRADIGTTVSAHQVCNVACVTEKHFHKYQSNVVRCTSDDRKVPVIRTRSHGSIIRGVRSTDYRQSVERETQEYEEPCGTDTCPRDMLNLIKEDPSIAFMLQKLLHNILSTKQQLETHSTDSSLSNLQTDHEYICHLKGKCTVDVTEIISKIKEYAAKILGSDVDDCTKNEQKEFCHKFDACTFSGEVEEKPTTKTQSCPYASTLTMTDKNDLKLKFQSTVIEQDDIQQCFEKDTDSIKKVNERLPTVDKEVCAYSSKRDVHTNGSLVQLLRRDAEIQSSSTPLFKDHVFTDKQERTSVGTQKRDPILVHVIKCNKNQADKGKLTGSTDTNVVEKCGKRIEACNQSTCSAYAKDRKPNETSVQSGFRKKRESLIDNSCRKRSIINKNYICGPQCKDGANSDWTDVTSITACPNSRNSKIPSSVRFRKDTR